MHESPPLSLVLPRLCFLYGRRVSDNKAVIMYFHHPTVSSVSQQHYTWSGQWQSTPFPSWVTWWVARLTLRQSESLFPRPKSTSPTSQKSHRLTKSDRTHSSAWWLPSPLVPTSWFKQYHNRNQPPCGHSSVQQPQQWRRWSIWTQWPQSPLECSRSAAGGESWSSHGPGPRSQHTLTVCVGELSAVFFQMKMSLRCLSIENITLFAIVMLFPDLCCSWGSFDCWGLSLTFNIKHFEVTTAVIKIKLDCIDNSCAAMLEETH